MYYFGQNLKLQCQFWRTDEKFTDWFISSVTNRKYERSFFIVNHIPDVNPFFVNVFIIIFKRKTFKELISRTSELILTELSRANSWWFKKLLCLLFWLATTHSVRCGWCYTAGYTVGFSLSIIYFRNINSIKHTF